MQQLSDQLLEQFLPAVAFTNIGIKILMWVDGSNACAVVELVLFKDSNYLKGGIGLETPSHTAYCSNTDCYLEL